ncbi:type II toxin-antitoxin system HicB family antitoxin [Longimicrobium terrae]|uniref:Type II toxin-antitoxin system HicB family antitoxin n=1 Tax=Longimicrobium terrae TaxID=1639882 RepID=A0A841H453_9BACT|nr:type II toxin-antitoxin system HicB family antitoxin [Longimicrobium terrae]MBB4638588.1 hypothetical protein [Longimicrobium terrae]MBB6072774.1 hypothetical protein [Longimicrobium terrae]NNC30607.1 type II toxin-antitoxin system HicB family antitoxin [Longimicrobium terrae]
MDFNIELDREVNGRWIAEIHSIPGVLVYDRDPDDAIANARALALHIRAGRIERGRSGVLNPLHVTIH